MNNVVLCGRLTRDPEVRVINRNDGSQLSIASFTVAVDRPFSKNEDRKADFIRCKAFGVRAESIEKYMYKGMKIDLNGRIETDSYTDKDGKKVYTTEVIVDNWEFGESKRASEENTSRNRESAPTPQKAPEDDFYSLDGLDENLPFN